MSTFGSGYKISRNATATSVLGSTECAFISIYVTGAPDLYTTLYIGPGQSVATALGTGTFNFICGIIFIN